MPTEPEGTARDGGPHLSLLSTACFLLQGAFLWTPGSESTAKGGQEWPKHRQETGLSLRVPVSL